MFFVNFAKKERFENSPKNGESFVVLVPWGALAENVPRDFVSSLSVSKFALP